MTDNRTIDGWTISGNIFDLKRAWIESGGAWTDTEMRIIEARELKASPQLSSEEPQSGDTTDPLVDPIA